MRPTLRPVVTVLAMAGLLMSGCDLLDTSSPKDATELPNDTQTELPGDTQTELPGDTQDEMTVSYRVQGEYLLVDIPEEIDCYSWCDWNDVLTTECDTSEAEIDTVRFAVSGNTLELWFDIDTLAESGAVVADINTFNRQGSGSGLVGTWVLAGTEYRILSGTPTIDEQQELDDDYEIESAESWGLQITSSAITVVMYYSVIDNLVRTMNEEFVDEGVALTVVKTGPTALTVTGDMSGEAITATYNEAAGTITFRSSNADRTVHVYYENPVACPNEYFPPWGYEFIMENADMAGFEKRAATVLLRPAPRRTPLSIWKNALK